MTARGPYRVALWLGSAAPVRSVRWLDGALAIAARFAGATAVAAGHPAWLDLAADRAARQGVASVGVATDLELDYLGWAQVMASVARKLAATTILVDEASRPDRFAEVAALAELCDAAQLSHVVALEPSELANPTEPGAESGTAVIEASRAAGRTLQRVRIRGAAVIGLRIAGAAIDDYETPMPAAAMRRLDLAALGLDHAVLGHRALPARPGQHAARSLEQVADHLAVHVALPKGE
jgi:hypothetical protein